MALAKGKGKKKEREGKRAEETRKDDGEGRNFEKKICH
jgi:hypothetical protein